VVPSPADQLASLSALVGALDLANGLPGDKSLLTGLFAFELAQEAGLTTAQARHAFHAGLLRHLGCTAYASEEARLGEDDIGLRRALLSSDPLQAGDVVRAVRQANHSPARQAGGLYRLLTSSRRLRAEWSAEACGAAGVLARGLGQPPEVLLALDEVFERWDGRGGPAGLQGEACSAVGRVAQAAHVAVLFALTSSKAVAQEMLATQAGHTLEPRLSKLATQHLPSLGALTPARLERLEASLALAPLSLTARAIAECFGDFADLQTPSTRGHSRRVARACLDGAQALGLPGREDLELAALLHDLGQVAVPTGLWLRPKWGDADVQAARHHTVTTEQLLARAPLFAAAAPLAGAHHERLDGSGYHRQQRGPALPRAARLLAAAEVFVALQEPRAHRPAHRAAEVTQVLSQEVTAGRLDADCVSALLGTKGAAPAASGLTEREVEVLQQLAAGHTNKEIAQTLGISARTVQHHSIHIYEKLGVKTRAAAALLAARAGLLDGPGLR
jgi:HD-GYP domain-containing protein (c-di-GMP phosphodiesterase class II)